MSLDRVKEQLAAFIRSVMSGVDYHALYAATLQAPSTDGLVDVLPDDTRIRGTGLSRVPLHHGLPGVRLSVPAGTRVLIGYENGDPQKPFAALWNQGPVTLIQLGEGTTDFVALAAKVLTEFTAIKTWSDAHIHPTGMGPSGPPATPMPAPGSVAATKLKAE